jgi:hypothetical protein
MPYQTQEKPMETNASDELKQEKFRIGLTILLLLIVFTIGEFGIAAVGANIAAAFFGIALLKAFLVVRDYMHIGRLFDEEEAE